MKASPQKVALAVVCGFSAWTVLWLGTNAGLAGAFASSFREDGSTDSAGILVCLLVASVVVSVIAGVTAAAVDRSTPRRSTLILAFILLAVGIAVQAGHWDKIPLWYHLPFLALLVPATLAGGRVLGPAQHTAQQTTQA